MATAYAGKIGIILVGIAFNNLPCEVRTVKEMGKHPEFKASRVSANQHPTGS